MSLQADALMNILSSVVPDIKWRYQLADQSDVVIIFGRRSARKGYGSVEDCLPVLARELSEAFKNESTAANFAAILAEQIIEGLDAIDNYSRKTGHQGTAKVGSSQEGLHSSENGGVRTEGRTLMELFALDGGAV